MYIFLQQTEASKYISSRWMYDGSTIFHIQNGLTVASYLPAGTLIIFSAHTRGGRSGEAGRERKRAHERVRQSESESERGRKREQERERERETARTQEKKGGGREEEGDACARESEKYRVCACKSARESVGEREWERVCGRECVGAKVWGKECGERRCGAVRVDVRVLTKDGGWESDGERVGVRVCGWENVGERVCMGQSTTRSEPKRLASLPVSDQTPGLNYPAERKSQGHICAWHDSFVFVGMTHSACEWVLPHVSMSHVTGINESCHTYDTYSAMYVSDPA